MLRRWPAFAAAAVGLLWFLQIGGAHTLVPTNIDWILSGDWRQHWLGWLFFRREAWTFPLGTVTSLPYPIGTTIGFTDSNPLVSLLLKPFSSLLPSEFQFVGPWLALCFILQGYMGARLASVVTRDPGQQMLGGCMFVFSPTLLARLGHDTLCAHWLLLGLMCIGLREYADSREARRASWFATAAVMLAAATHPYLAAMSYTLTVAGLVRFWRTRLMTLRRAAVALAATTAGLVAVLGLIGYIGTTSVGSTGFGVYSSDLLTLINADTLSRLLPPLRGNWEGLGFVGLGGLLAAAVAGVLIVRQRQPVPAFAKPVVIVCVLMAVYALSSHITVDGYLVLRIRRIYDRIRPLTSAFRASGRFIWPLHYLVLLTGIWALVRVGGAARQSAGTAILALAVIVQAADLRPDANWAADKHFRQAPLGDFALARGHYQHMAVFPTQILGGCGEDKYEEDHVYRWMLQAYRLNLTYNSGIFARFSLGAAQAECGRLIREVGAGTIDPQTIYVVDVHYLFMFQRAGAACGRFDGDWICVSNDSNERFRTLVATGK